MRNNLLKPAFLIISLTDKNVIISSFFRLMSGLIKLQIHFTKSKDKQTKIDVSLNSLKTNVFISETK